MSTVAQIGLGSNLGDRKARLDAAVAALSGTPGVTLLAVSGYHETVPVGGPGGQGAFLNAAARLETSLAPLELLGVLHAIEGREGRVRDFRWGERTLDLDLLLFGDVVSRTKALKVPHPRFAVRRFVLAPLAEVAPDAVDPLTGRTIADLLARLDRRPGHLALGALPGGVDRHSLFRRIVDLLEATGLSLAEGAGDDPSDLDALLGRWSRALADSLGSAESRGDRWLVSDVGFEALRSTVDRGPDPRVGTASREGVLEGLIRILDPTFVVAILSTAPSEQPLRPGPPILECEASDPDEIVAEVVAACASARGG